MDGDFDLNGKTLTLTGVSKIEGDGCFKGAEGSALDLTISADCAVKAANTFLTENVKLIVRGDGKTLTIPKTNSHTGGTEIRSGRLAANTSTTRDVKKDKLFGTGPLDVYPEGILQIKGYTNWNEEYPINLRGGTIENTYEQTKVFDAPINICADSSFLLTASCVFAPVLISGTGKLSVEGTGTMTIGKDISMPTVSLSVAAPFALGAYGLEVNDYEVRDGGLVSGAGTIAVNGTFKPTAGTAGTTFLKNGSEIDLSERADVWSGDSVAFDANARVTIALGDRPLTSNLQIVSWKKKPSEVSFDFTGDHIGEREFTVSDGGIVYDAQSSAIASATWTGEGAAGNWMDPANWNCENASGGSLKDEAPTVDMTVTFSGDVSDVAFDEQFPFAGVRFVNAELSKVCNWTGFDLNLLTDDSVLDVKGNALTVSAGTGESTTAATIANSGTEATLTLDVAEGQAYTNGTLNISGSLRFVKTGAGVYVAKKYPQTYTGITEVEAGVLRCDEKADLNANGAKDAKDAVSPFGATRTVELLPGGVLDPAGSMYWAFHTINMRGGAISNTVEQMGRGTSYNSNVKDPFNPVLNLHVDSVMASTETFNFQGAVNLKDDAKCLELRIAPNKQFLWFPSATKNLHLKVTQGGWLDIWQRAAVTAEQNPGFTLEMSGAALALYYYISTSGATCYPGGLGVCNYISSYGEKYNQQNDAVMTVSGTFTPQGDYFYGCTMLDGSTIDLGGKDAAWSIRSQSDNNNTVKFAEEATVKIDVGGRTVEADDVLVTWPEATDYEGRKFELVGDDVEGLALNCDATGIRVVSTDTKTAAARWTNADGDGDFCNTNNWYCTNARGAQLFGVLPDQDTAVEFPVAALANLNCAEKAFDYASLTLTNEHPETPLELAQDCDWRGLGEMDFTFPIDLNGHDLTLTLGNVVVTNAQTIANSSSSPARLFLSVPEGKTYLNGGLDLSGNLTLVKLGEGTYVAAKAEQTYSGRTIVSNGVLQCIADADLSGCQPFGAQKEIDVAGGALDPAGSYNWAAYTLNMRGGAIQNTVAQIGCGNSYLTTSFPKPFDPTLKLFAPTVFASAVDFNFKGVIRANDNQLTMATKLFVWAATTEGAAEVEFTSGKLKTLKNFPPVTPEMTLVMNGATFDFGCDALNVKDYIAKTTAYDAVRKNDEWRNKDGVLNVSGVFTPVSQKFFGCTMLDGSTICLADKSGVWSTKAQSSNGNGRLFVDFAEGAKVTIDVHGRTFKGDVQIVQWEEGSTNNLDTVKFKLDDASRSAGYSLTFKPYVDDTNKGGLWIGRKGMMLLLR